MTGRFLRSSDLSVGWLVAAAACLRVVFSLLFAIVYKGGVSFSEASHPPGSPQMGMLIRAPGPTTESIGSGVRDAASPHGARRATIVGSRF